MTTPLLKSLGAQLSLSTAPVFVLGNPGTGMVATIEEAVKIKAQSSPEHELPFVSLSALDVLDAVPTPLLYSSATSVIDVLGKLAQSPQAVLHINVPTQLSKNEQQSLLDVVSSRQVTSGKTVVDLSNATLIVSGFEKLVDPEFLAAIEKVSTVLTTPDIEPTVSAQSIQQRRQASSTSSPSVKRGPK